MVMAGSGDALSRSYQTFINMPLSPNKYINYNIKL